MPLIYLDSCIVIYLIERHPQYVAIVERALADLGEAIIVSSPLVRLEVLVKPMQDGDEQLIRLYHQFLATNRMLPITDDIFDAALNLRVQHRLKTPDALHLALAEKHGCSALWTNDNRLANAGSGISVNILAQYAPQ
jgi:predicted nucleic acid-binding protein